MSSKISSKFKNQSPSIWITINKIVAAEKPINLGQGFPDFPQKDDVIKNLKDVADGPYNLHQYTRGHGHLRLVEVLSKLYESSLKREINAQEEVLVSVGAYGSLFATMNAYLEAGDEAIIIEPFFDCYQAMVESAGAKAKFVQYKIPTNNNGELVKASQLYLDEQELRGLVNKETKLIIINTPNNPNGHVMNEKELSMIAKLCVENDLICVSDEVYEWLVYPPNRHLKIASLPNMWERTITIGSVGKTLNMTGWKLGWAIGTSDMLQGLRYVQQNSVYTCPTPLQEAAARSLETELELLKANSDSCYLTQVAKDLVGKRDLIVKELVDLGMRPIVPDGGYFILADFTKLLSDEFIKEARDKGEALDVHFNNWMIKNIKVSGIPNSAFYSKQHRADAEIYIRFCFFKKDETLQSAFAAFKKWKESNGGRKIGPIGV